MELYISGCIDEYNNIFSNYNTVSFDEANCVLILPGGLGCLNDLFKSINMKKRVILFNYNFFYTPIIKKLYEMYKDGYEDKVPSEYMEIESEIDKIIEKLEEK